MKIKNGRVTIECEKDRTKFSEEKYKEFLARKENANAKTAPNKTQIQARAALHEKTA